MKTDATPETPKDREHKPAADCSAKSGRLWKDRDWSDYPLGTKAHAYNGGHWMRVPAGWKWFCGSTFPTPGGDAIGACIELPNNAVRVK